MRIRIQPGRNVGIYPNGGFRINPGGSIIPVLIKFLNYFTRIKVFPVNFIPEFSGLLIDELTDGY
jgi:hypothetical protein